MSVKWLMRDYGSGLELGICEKAQRGVHVYVFAAKKQPL